MNNKFSSSTSSKDYVNNLLPEEFIKKINSTENLIIVDVRTKQEYKGGFITNAINIDVYEKDFFDKMNKIDKRVNIFLYCHSGVRSYYAGNELSVYGFQNVYNLVGGILGWQEKLVVE